MALTCNACLKVYPNTSCLQTHIKVVHKTSPSSLGLSETDWHYVCLEKNCKKQFKSSKILISHLKKQHGFKFEHVQTTVANMDEFFKWKSNIEKDDDYKYILKNTMDNQMYQLTYYKCNKCHKPEQTLKKSGTKMKTYCTSQLKLFKEHGKEKITIFWIKTHYGHGIEIPNLKNKLDDKEILETIESIPKDNKRRLKRKKLQYDSDSSTDMMEMPGKNGLKVINKPTVGKNCFNTSTVFNNYDNDSILFHKKQESRRIEHFETNDFCLIIMNNYQKDLLKRFGDNLIVVDSTQSLSNHDFDLTTLAILDEYNQGFPVVYMLCNRKDILTFTFFFKTIKKFVDVIHPKIFMSDLIESYYDAWIKIMGPADHHIFCPWRIKQAWMLDLNKIENVEKQKEVSEILLSLQKEPEEYNFQIMLNDIVQYFLEDEETEQFGKYFKNNYCGNYQKWAFCVQQEYGLNTDVNLNSIYELTNHFELVLLQERSFDAVLQTVFKYIRDKISERNLKVVKEKKPFSDYEVQYIDNYWNVQDYNEIVCKVTKISDKKCCNNICSCCNTCPHMYTCDCFNYLSKKIICIHIHCVQNELRQNDDSVIAQNDINKTEDVTEVKKENELNTTENFNELENKKNYKAISELKFLIESTFNKLQTTKLDNLENFVIDEITSNLNIIDRLLTFDCQSPKK